MKKVVMIISAAVLLTACGSKDVKDAEAVDSTNIKKGVAANQKEEILKKINYYDSLTKLPGVTVPN
jgi:major membrane immunogen (membrane-anchored lipoprotein)